MESFGYATEMNPKLKGKKTPLLPTDPTEEYIPPAFNASEVSVFTIHCSGPAVFVLSIRCSSALHWQCSPRASAWWTACCFAAREESRKPASTPAPPRLLSKRMEAVVVCGSSCEHALH